MVNILPYYDTNILEALGEIICFALLGGGYLFYRASEILIFPYITLFYEIGEFAMDLLD